MEQIINNGQDQQIVVERKKVKVLRKKVVKKGKEHVRSKYATFSSEQIRPK